MKGKYFLATLCSPEIFTPGGKCKDIYSSPNIIRTIKSRRMRWAGHVT
jgi:hypothetical protein